MRASIRQPSAISSIEVVGLGWRLTGNIRELHKAATPASQAALGTGEA